ncbi:MAG: type II secretion system protein [Phycisphaerales bacterium]
MTMPRKHHHHRRGFTLVEAAVSIVIVGVMLTAAISMLGAAAGVRRRTALWREGESLARALLVEVQQSGYGSTSGPLPVYTFSQGQNRSRWLVVDRFNGLTETAPTDRTGVELPGYQGWQRSVTVERVDPDNPGGPARVVTGDTGLKRITVTSIAPGGERTTLVGLRSRWGLVDAAAKHPGVVLTGLNIGISTGSDGRAYYTAVTVPNSTSEAGRVASLPASDDDDDDEPGLLGGVVGGLNDALRGLLGGGG